jgi:hypothetical protein
MIEGTSRSDGQENIDPPFTEAPYKAATIKIAISGCRAIRPLNLYTFVFTVTLTCFLLALLTFHRLKKRLQTILYDL